MEGGQDCQTHLLQLALVFAALGKGLCDDSPLDLTSGSLWQLVNEVHLCWDFERGEMFLQEACQFFIGHFFSLFQDNSGLDHLAIHVIGNTKGDGFFDLGVRKHDTMSSMGEIFSPPLLMSSLILPVSTKNPSGSK